MDDPQIKIHKKEECVEMIEDNKMSLESYYLGHQDAKLSTKQRQDLIFYLKKQIEETKLKMP